ncbi:MAG: hypothetical protein WA208_02520 [Thermoanaerobaculia bacterium]
MNERGASLFPSQQRRHRIHRGLATARQEHIFNWSLVVVVLLYATAWVGAIVELRRIQHAATFGAPVTVAAPGPVTRITDRILGPDPAATTPYLTDAMLGFLHPLRGESGEVKFAPVLPGTPVVPEAPGDADAVLSQGEQTEVSPDFAAPSRPGIYKFAVEMGKVRRAIDDINIITLVPISQKRGGKIGTYYLGTWPWEDGGKPRSERYAPPGGFIEVTRENEGTYVSEHFRLRDFLTKDQGNVWPKYLLLDPKLIDKLELTLQELENEGVDVRHVTVMSGFRTPRYNHSGGNTEGRANLSRHMYGDGADVFVDNDRNGNMDDINRDGRVDTRDAEMMGRAAEAVERKHPGLVGGVGVYSACCGHGPFLHVDVRGYRARWRGTGNG